MNARKPSAKVRASAKSSPTKTPDENSFVQRILEKTLSDNYLLRLVEENFRTHTIGLIRTKDGILEQWLDINDDGDITVKFLLLGPPFKPKRKGVKITVINA